MTLLCCTIISGGLLKVCWRCLIAASAGSVPYLLSRCGRSWRCQEVGLPSFFEEYDQSVWKERWSSSIYSRCWFLHVLLLLSFPSHLGRLDQLPSKVCLFPDFSSALLDPLHSLTRQNSMVPCGFCWMRGCTVTHSCFQTSYPSQHLCRASGFLFWGFHQRPPVRWPQW